MSTPANLRQPASAREHLLKRRHLLLLALALLVVLGLLAPTSNMLASTLTRPDQLSLQYLRLLTAVHPVDVALKLRLAETLFAMGRLEEASNLLDSLPRTDPRLQQAIWRLGLRIHLSQYAQDKGRAGREPQLVTRLVKELEALVDQSLSTEELVGLVGDSLSIGQSELAGRIYLRLSVTDPTQREKWLTAAAQQKLASNQPAMAGVVYDELAKRETNPQARRRYALLALTALTSANRGDKALVFAKRYLEWFPDDRDLLAAAAKLALQNGEPAAAAAYYDTLVRRVTDRADRLRFAKLALLSMSGANQADLALLAAGRYLEQFAGEVELLTLATKLALANQKPRLAQTWGRALLARDPNDGTLLANQIDIELAAGDPVAALSLGQRLVARHPGNRKQRERVAQLALWGGQPSVALVELTYLALHTGDHKYLDQALKMAPQLYELETLADLLALKARRGRLTNTELASLVETFENVARPEELVQILTGYLQRYPDHREAWEALAEVQERRGDLEAALATFTRLSRDFGSSTKEVTHRAELLWQLHQPSKAYVLLRDALDHAGIATTHELLTRAELTGEHDKEGTHQEKEGQSFLKLLAELLWQSEPRPETLAEYRLLWQKGALLRESAERYIQLAEAQGLIDEAISTSVTAFQRFKDPEFLLGAMDIANKFGRAADMERLLTLARQHDELFASSKRYYLTLAEYYTHQKDYDRAQRAYLKVVALDPRTVAARADVLWLLIDHSDDRDRLRGKHNRLALERFLHDWDRLAQAEPALWLPFATGWAMLGHAKPAISYYRREWNERPTDHLWLLGYISTLDAVSRTSDVRNLRRFALEQLRPDALHAAHPGATPAERELLKAYAELVRDTYGAGKGSRWMAQVLSAELEPGVQKGLLATWRSDGENAAPNGWVTDSRTVSRKNPWGRFPKAPKRGQEQSQATLADASTAPDESQDPPVAPLLVLAQDAAAGEDQVPQNAQIIGLSTGIQTVNDLAILNTSISALVARGIWAIGGHLGVNQLFLNGNDDPQASATEVDLAVYGQWRHRLGRLEVGLGANLRADANLWSGWASETFRLWRGGTLQLGLHINELATDSKWLRIYGARHRLTVGLSTSFAEDGILNIQGNFYHYHTRTNEDIGAGGNVDLELGYRIHRVRPLWTVRISGSYTRNFQLTDQVPDFGKSSSSALALIDTLPLEFAAVGVGSRVEHRFPGISPIGAGRWRYFADAWVGWLWPVNLVGIEMSAGVGLALPRKQELVLKAFVANNRWLGPGVINAGVNLNYLFR